MVITAGSARKSKDNRRVLTASLLPIYLVSAMRQSLRIPRVPSFQQACRMESTEAIQNGGDAFNDQCLPAVSSISGWHTRQKSVRLSAVAEPDKNPVHASTPHYPDTHRGPEVRVVFPTILAVKNTRAVERRSCCERRWRGVRHALTTVGPRISDRAQLTTQQRKTRDLGSRERLAIGT